MRGQLTMEYLFLMLISLVLITISLTALITLSNTGSRAYHLGLFKSSVLDVYNAGEELCAMGSGNSRKIKIMENISISESEGKTIFSNTDLNISIPKTTFCKYNGVELSVGNIIIKNEDGSIITS